MEEEYENQQSWRTSADKLTFIICEPLAATDSTVVITPEKQDSEPRMVGDVNFFLYPDDENEENSNALIGEVDVMIAGKQHRGKGYGDAAVRSLLLYIHSHLDALLKEYVQGQGGGEAKKMLRALMVKIQEGNVGSRALFGKLGFKQVGEVNYFGEVKMVLDWTGAVKGQDERWAAARTEYRELEYR